MITLDTSVLKMPDVAKDTRIVSGLVKDALNRGGKWIAGDWMSQAAHTYAPVSPTQAQIDQERAKRKGVKVSRVAQARRRRKTKTKPEPGGLERSISAAVDGEGHDMSIACFVRTPSEAQAYANVIHNEKGKRWHNRGLGTRAKGEKADEKFIERARDDNLQRYFRKLDAAIDKAILGK